MCLLGDSILNTYRTKGGWGSRTTSGRRNFTEIRQNGPPGQYAKDGTATGVSTQMRRQWCDLRANSEGHKHSDAVRAKIPEVYAFSGVSLVGIWAHLASLAGPCS